MKLLNILILLITFAFAGFGQISPSLKAGVGYNYVIDEDNSISPDFHTIKGYPNISVEKPFPVEVRLKPRLSINPGLAFNYFKENKVNGDTIIGKDHKLNHHSLSAYVKVFYQYKLPDTEAFFYLGPVGGINLITKTRGTKTVYGLNEEIPVYTDNVNQNGKDFFKMFYYGFLFGFQPNARKYNFIKPSFEFAYYPNFVYKPDSELVTDKNDENAQITYTGIGTIQFTVYLGFRFK